MGQELPIRATGGNVLVPPSKPVIGERVHRRTQSMAAIRECGISEYREVHYKPYRIISRIRARTMVVYCVLDGCRDMQTLLQRRLLH